MTASSPSAIPVAELGQPYGVSLGRMIRMKRLDRTEYVPSADKALDRACDVMCSEELL